MLKDLIIVNGGFEKGIELIKDLKTILDDSNGR